MPSIPAVVAALAAAAPAPRVLVPTAGQGEAVWRYTTRRPTGRWMDPSFDDASWREGRAAFGTPETPGTRIGTVWSTADIWLRHAFTLPSPAPFRRAALAVRHDEDAEIYLNGGRIFRGVGYLVEVRAYDVTAEARGLLAPGRNVLAVHCRQTAGGQVIDVGLVLDPAQRPAAKIDLKALRARRWSAERAWRWYRGVGPICGFNYVPRTAVNTTALWQRLDEATVDQELGWAEACGLTGARVFVQYLVYEAEPKALLGRMDRFLRIAARHRISVAFVLFDDCFGPEPALGPQPDPIPGVHNSRWTSSPGRHRKRPAYWPRLARYVRDVVERFGRDERVLFWDLYNEPKRESRPLLEAAFVWARDARPAQPLTACWRAADLSDIVTFHDYGPPDPSKLAALVAERPAIATECIARTRGSSFEAVLPAFARWGIGWYMWGLVKGRIQTHYPWGSKEGAPEPAIWFHDLLHPDGTPYRPEEIEQIRRFRERFRMPRRSREPKRPAGGY